LKKIVYHEFFEILRYLIEYMIINGKREINDMKLLIYEFNEFFMGEIFVKVTKFEE
jgi:hypothetical protein